MKNSIKIIVASIFAFSIFKTGKTQSCTSCATGPCLTLGLNKTYNGSGNFHDYGRAVTVDGSGNVYVTGQSVYSVNGSTIDNQIVTIKYNSAGVVQWTQLVNGGSWNNNEDAETGNAIALDASGNVWVAATTLNGLYYKYDMTLIKYNSAGTLQYVKRYADPSNGYDFTEGLCLVVKDANNVYLGGVSSSGLNYYGKVLKNNPSGGWYWAYSFNGASLANFPYNEAYDMKLNSAGTYLYITGVKNNGVTTNADVFTAKIDASNTGGTAAWTQTYSFSQSLDDIPNAMYLDANENVYIAGKTGTSSPNQGNNAFLMKYNSGGTLQWGNPVTYNYNNLDDAWVDIGGLGADGHGGSLIYVAGHGTWSASDANYITAAYNAGNGTLSSYWTQNPKIYDGSGTGSEPINTDWGYALEYDATTNKVFVTGRSFELNCPSSSANINITTLRYDGGTGTQEWRFSYDYGTDHVNWTDEVKRKNGLFVMYDVCTSVDFPYITGDSWVTSNGSLDYITLELNVICNFSPTHRLAQKNEIGIAEFYPNPFSTSATLQIKEDLKIENAELDIFDLQGKRVREIENINSNTIMIKKDDLPNGMYFYRLSDGNDIVTSGRFIISE